MNNGQKIKGVPKTCRECGSTALSWFAQNTVPSGIQQNRLNTHDVKCIFVLGCDDCSETLKTVGVDSIADWLNKPAAVDESAQALIQAVVPIIAAYREYNEIRFEPLTETFKHPATGVEQENGVTVSVRRLNQLGKALDGLKS